MRKPVVIHLVAAARPNFMKVAPLYHALSQEDWANPVLVHTGQHYDANMSTVFIQDLQLPEPDFHLNVDNGTHAEQTAAVMVAYERICLAQCPDWVVVVGDVNSTLACAITAKKLCLPVAHLEAGLRSRDLTMPEEINRMVTDAISDLLWTPSPDADENLRQEGVPAHKIVRVGNIMIDSYRILQERINAEKTATKLQISESKYGVVTLHRPSNVDNFDRLSKIVALLAEISEILPIIFPVHPRTRKHLNSFGLWKKFTNVARIRILEPMSYIHFMSLVQTSSLVITDSGGIQEETTYLNIPCLTLRETTERPITISQGTNQLVSLETLAGYVQAVVADEWQRSIRPEYWDGYTASRIVNNLEEVLSR